MADWEPRLSAAAQHHQRVWDHISLAQEKVKMRSTVSTECLLLSHHQKAEKSS